MARNSLINSLIIVAVTLGVIFIVFFLKARDAVQVAQVRARAPASAAAGSPAAVEAMARPPLATTTSDVRGVSPRAAPSTSPRTAEALPSVQGMTTNNEALRRDLEKEIQTLQAQLAERRRLVQQRAAALEQLRAGAASEANAGTNSSATGSDEGDRAPAGAAENASALEERGEQLRALSSDLSQMREAREALYQQEDDAVNIRENQNRMAIAQIDAQIVQAEEARAGTQAQIDRWSRDHAFVNGQVAKNTDLENKLAQEQQQLDALRQQRLALTEDLHVQTDTIYNLSQQARDQLRSEEQEVRTQIFSLQNEIRRIQQSQVQARRSEQTQTAQLQQAERALQSETEQLRRLESSLQSKQSDLRRLQ